MQHRNGILFIGGIHGVGKSRFSKTLADRFSLPHFSAGELIQRHRSLNQGPDKRVFDVDGHQEALIHGLQAQLKTCPTIILDGHFCVFNAGHDAEPIPLETFRRLNMLATVIIQDAPANIAERLGRRDNTRYDLPTLARLQEAEICHAKMVCHSLDVRLRIVNALESDLAGEFIEELLSPK